MLSKDNLLSTMCIGDARVEAFETYLMGALKDSTGIVEIDRKTLSYYRLVNPKIILNEVSKLRKLGYFVEIHPDKLIVSMIELQ